MNIFIYDRQVNPNQSNISTIKDLKNLLHNSNFDVPSAKLIVNDTKVLGSEVFQSEKYDSLDITRLFKKSNLIVSKSFTNKPSIKYYVIVDTGYEDERVNLPTYYPEELVAINNTPTDSRYNEIVRMLFERIYTMQLKMKHRRQFTNHPIFKVDDVNMDTIDKIIESVKSMEYNKIWGKSLEIGQYPISDEITLVHLKLFDVKPI